MVKPLQSLLLVSCRLRKVDALKTLIEGWNYAWMGGWRERGKEGWKDGGMETWVLNAIHLALLCLVVQIP